jgi:diadenosine tetraphosphatase ApaH/serine/threonine PP2A family protein phosphatase
MEEREMWLYLTSCTDDECPCGDMDALAEYDHPSEAVFAVHMGLPEGLFPSLDAAIAYYLKYDDDRAPFTRAQVRCMHGESVHAGRSSEEIDRKCNYRGILVATEGERRLIVFDRMEQCGARA